MDRLFIDNKEVEMGGEVGIYLTYRSNIMNGDISKILGNNSSTIKIPHTLHNAGIIENAQMVTSDTRFPYIRHTADVVRDGITLIHKATVILLKTTPKEYEVSLVWGVSEGLRQMAGENEKLPSLANIGYEYALVWKYQSAGTYRLPEAVYGFVRSVDNKKFTYHPVLSIYEVLSMIRDKYGVTFNLPSSVSYAMENLVMPILKSTTPPASVSLSKTTNGTVWWNSISKTRYTDVNSAGNLVVIKDDVKLSRLSIVYNSGLLLANRNEDYINLIFDTQYIAVIQYAERTKEDGTKEYDETEIAQIPVSSIDYEGFGQIGPEDDGYIYNITYALELEEDIATLNTGDLILFQIKRKPITNSTGESAVLQNLRLGQASLLFHQDSITLGEEYPLNRNMPDIEIMKWLKGVMQMLGLFAYTDNGGNLVMLDYPTFFSRKPGAQDWSEYLCITATDASEELEYEPEGFYQKNLVQYKDDDANKDMDSYFYVQNDALDAEGTYIELPFSSVRTVSVTNQAYNERFSQMAVIPMYEQKNEDAENWNPITERVSGEEGKAYLLWRRQDTYGSYYLSREGLDWGTLLNTSYQGIIQSVQQAHYITATFYLDAVALQRVDFGYPIYLQQYASYFAIIEIKTKANNLAEVKLLKLV